MNLLGEPAFVGRHCGAHEYEIDRETVDFYADALDDPSPLYAEIGPSLLHHSECYKVLGQWYLKNLFGNLHGGQDWELYRPHSRSAPACARAPPSSTGYLRAGSRLGGERDRSVCDAEDGRLLVRGRTHQSFLPPDRKPGEGFVVDGETARKKSPRPPFPGAEGEDLAPVTKQVDARRCWMFSGPGRNYHTDADEARKLGFPNIVVQGMMSTCFAAQVMQDHFGMGWVVGGKLSAKLTNVLWVDERVTARARVRERQSEGTRTRVHCDVWIDKDDGTRILVGDASALE